MSKQSISDVFYSPPPPRVSPGGELVQVPSENDVILSLFNTHQGNVKLRNLVLRMEFEYNNPSITKFDWAHIAARTLWTIRASDPPGRFLKQDKGTEMWEEIGDQEAFRKVVQLLRENAVNIRSYWKKLRIEI